MRLTGMYSRVAMPPNEPCPHCDTVLDDWFREWYLPDEQPKIFQGKIAADCPVCGKGVFLRKGVDPALKDVPVLQRVRSQASNWVQRERRMYKDLDDYLNSSEPAARFFKNYSFR